MVRWGLVGLVAGATLMGDGGGSTFVAGLAGLALGTRFENTEEQNQKLGGCAGCGCVPALLALVLFGAIPASNWDGFGDLFGIDGYNAILRFSQTLNSWVALLLAYLIVRLWPSGLDKTFRPRLGMLLALVALLVLSRFLPGQAESARGYNVTATIVRIDLIPLHNELVEPRFYYRYYDHGQWHTRRFSPLGSVGLEDATALAKRNPVGSHHDLELWITRDLLKLQYY